MDQESIHMVVSHMTKNQWMEDIYLAPGPPMIAMENILVEGNCMHNVWDKTNGLNLFHTARKVMLVIFITKWIGVYLCILFRR